MKCNGTAELGLMTVMGPWKGPGHHELRIFCLLSPWALAYGPGSVLPLLDDLASQCHSVLISDRSDSVLAKVVVRIKQDSI